MRAAFDRRRQTIVRMLREIPGVTCPEPMGAFYVYPSVKGLLGQRDPRPAAGDAAPSCASWCWRRPRSRWCPARRSARPGYVRLSYALGDDDLVEGVTRLHKLLAEAADRRGVRPAAAREVPAATRSCAALPKAHLHLHFTGSLRPATLLRAGATGHGVRLPDALRRRPEPSAELRATDERGLVPLPAALRHRPLGGARRGRRPAAACSRPPRTSAREGSGWLEIQVDPTGVRAPCSAG